MDGNAQPIGLDRRRTRWPSAAACAFIASGLTIVSFTANLMQQRAIASARSAGGIPLGVSPFNPWAILATVSQLIMIAAQAKAFWGIARVQQAVAPVSARLGQRAFIAFLVAAVLVVPVGFPIALMAGNTTSVWMKISAVPLCTLALAHGFFGWASRGSSYPWQRWAGVGLLVLAGNGLFNVILMLFLSPGWQYPTWLSFVLMGLPAGTWAAVGGWLRQVPEISRPGNHAVADPSTA